jgi:hypothetical protein
MHQPPRQQGPQNQCVRHLGSRQRVQGVLGALLLHRLHAEAPPAKRQVQCDKLQGALLHSMTPFAAAALHTAFLQDASINSCA